MTWVTWTGVKIDRIGCAWLIRRFIDPDARFDYIEHHQTPPPGETPFDIPGVRFSHHQGHASFHALCAGHDLDDPALQRIAAIIDAADATGDAALHPEAVGLETVFSVLAPVAGSDEEAVRIGAVVFDALYVALGGSVQR